MSSHQRSDETSSVSNPVRNPVQGSREVRSQVLVVDQVGEGGSAVGTHGEGDEDDGEDWCATRVAQGNK